MADEPLCSAEDVQFFDGHPIETHRPTLDPLFVVLGFLEEYLGRAVVEQGSVVERFYPVEWEATQRFDLWLRELARTRGITMEIVRRIGPSGHVCFENAELTSLVDASYRPVFDDERTITFADGRCHRQDRCGIPRDVFAEMSFHGRPQEALDQRFSYLLGAHSRFGRGTTFRFANACHKAALIRDLLIALRCPCVAWKTWPNQTPTGHEIEFEPTEALKVLLRIQGS